jgi:hypothetical protein
MKLRYAAVLAVLLLIFAGWILGTSSSYNDCKAKQTAAQSEQAKENAPPIVLPLADKTAICARCAGHVIYEYRDAVTAVATVFIAIFTFTLWLATYRLWISGDRQIGISEQLAAIAKAQHIAANRPRLLVRHIEISSAFSEQFTIMFSHGAKIRGRLMVVNAGGSKAHIVTSEHRIFAAKDGLPIRPPYGIQSPRLLAGGQSLEVGEACECAISDTLIMPFDERLGRPVHQFSDEGWSLYVMGRISYMDEAGAERFMGFCRERKPDGRFQAVKDPDYEYED